MLKRVILLAVAVFAMALSGATLRFKSDNAAVSDGIWFTDTQPNLSLDMDLNAKVTSQFTAGEQLPYACFALEYQAVGEKVSNEQVKIEFSLNYGGRIFKYTMYTDMESNYKNGTNYGSSTWAEKGKAVGVLSLLSPIHIPSGNYSVNITAYYAGLEAKATKILRIVNPSVTIGQAIGCEDAISKGWIKFENNRAFPWLAYSRTFGISGLLGKNESSILTMSANKDVFVEYKAAMNVASLVADEKYNRDTFTCYHLYGTSAQQLLFTESQDEMTRSLLLSEGEDISFVYKRDSSNLNLAGIRFGSIREMIVSPVVDVSFNSAGGSSVLPIKCVSGKTYDFLCEKYGKWSFPENGPNPPRKDGVEYKFLGWYNSAGQRITGASIVPDKAEDHVLTARWETSEPLPDLVVSSASVSKSRISRSESVVVSCRVENQGNSSAARSTTIFNCAGKTRSASCLALSPGEGWECSATFSGSALGVGTHTIIITADGASIVGESDDNNNSRSVTVTVVDGPSGNSRPDLIVASAYVSKSSIDISESVTVFCKVKNSGTGSAGSSQVRFSYKGVDRYVSCPALAPGGSATVSLRIEGGSLGAGMREITVAVDGEYNVIESDEYNNTKTVTVFVSNEKSSRDFDFVKLDHTEIDSFYLSKTRDGKEPCVEFNEYEPIFIKFSFWDVKRNFTANEVHAKIELDEDRWYSWKWDWFSGIVYHNYAPNILQNLSPGNYKVKVTLDYDNWWDEICETNNVREISFVVKGEPEYTIKFHREIAFGFSEIARRYTYGVSTALPSASALGWTRNGAVFKGWATSAANAAAGKVWKKGGAIVAKPVAAGKTLDVYAVWDDTYTIRFIRNEGSGYVSNKTFKYGTKTRIPSLNSLGWARRGYTFKGWATSTANARNGKIWKKDWAYVSTATTAGKTLTVYAVWSLKSGYYAIRFNKNDGTGKWRELGYKYGDNTTLPTIANGLQWSRAGYRFGGWATSAANAANGIAWRGDKGVTRTPVAAGKTLNVYAIWKKTGASATEANAFAHEPMSPASLPSSGAGGLMKLLPGYYSGELADGTGTYDLLVDEGGETGYVNIVFDDGSAVSVEVEVDFLDDIILVIDEAEEQYPLMR